MSEHSNVNYALNLLKRVFEVARSLFRGIFLWITGEKFRWTDWIVLGLYAVLVSFGIRHHEPWSDEAFAWVMARDSDFPTLLGILFHNYENHPGLQHMLLFPLTRIGFPYEAQAVMNVIFSVASVFVFLKKAPLPRATKYLFIFSFYMAFEYALITRPYILAIFLIFCIAAVYPRRFSSPLAYGSLVFLLFNSDYIPFALGIAILLTYGMEWYGGHRSNKRVLAAFLIMLVAAAWIFKQGILVPQDHYDAGENAFLGAGNFFYSMRKAIFPQGPAPYMFTWLEPFVTHFCVLFFLGALAVLWRNATAFLGLFLTLLEFFFLFAFKRVGDIRHFGFLLVILLFGVWISRSGKPDPSLTKFWKTPSFLSKEVFQKILIGLLTACLMIGSPFTLYAYVLEYTRTFSGAKQMGMIINAVDRRIGLKENGYVIVTSSPRTTGVAAYLPGTVMWNACMERFIGYYPATKELRSCDDLAWSQILARAEKQFHDLSRVLLLTKAPLPFERAGGYRFLKIGQTDSRPFGYMYEKFFLYVIQKEPSKAGPV